MSRDFFFHMFPTFSILQISNFWHWARGYIFETEMQSKHHFFKNFKNRSLSLSVIFRFQGKGNFYFQVHLQDGYTQWRKIAPDKTAWDSTSMQSIVIAYSNLFWFPTPQKIMTMGSFTSKPAETHDTLQLPARRLSATWAVCSESPFPVLCLLHLHRSLLLYFMLSFPQLPFELYILAP